MMRIIILLALCLGSTPTTYAQMDAKETNESGKSCALKTWSDSEEISEGEIECHYLEFIKLPVQLKGGQLSSKDKSILETELLPLLQRGFKIELGSDFVSNQSSKENELTSIRRAIILAQYLSGKGVDDRLFLIHGFGDEKNTTGFSYRAINFEAD